MAPNVLYSLSTNNPEIYPILSAFCNKYRERGGISKDAWNTVVTYISIVVTFVHLIFCITMRLLTCTTQKHGKTFAKELPANITMLLKT